MTRALTDLAEQAEISGTPDEAVAAWRRVVEASPTAFAWARLSAVLHSKENFDDAEAAARAAIAIDPSNVLALNVLGLAFHGRGALAQARDAYEASLNLSEDQPVLNLFADVLRRLGDDASAEAALRRSLELAPDEDDALFLLGLVLLKDRPGEAVDRLKRSFELDPTRRRLRRHLGEAYVKERRYDDALPLLQEAVVEDPEDSWSRFLLGRTLERTDDLTAARKQYLQATELAPDVSSFWGALAGVVDRLGNVAEADRLFRKALALDSADPVVLRAYGLYLSRTGFPNKARKYLRRALAAFPDDEQLREALVDRN